MGAVLERVLIKDKGLPTLEVLAAYQYGFDRSL